MFTAMFLGMVIFYERSGEDPGAWGIGAFIIALIEISVISGWLFS